VEGKSVGEGDSTKKNNIKGIREKVDGEPFLGTENREKEG